MKKIILLGILLTTTFLFASSTKLYNYVNQNVNEAELVEYINNDISRFSARHNIDPNIIAAIIKVDSNFDWAKEGTSDKVGLMQISRYKLESEVWDSREIFITENIRIGIEYFTKCLNDNNRDLALALAAYKGGQNKILKYNGIPPVDNIQDYVDNVIEIYNSYFENNYSYKNIVFNKKNDFGFKKVEVESEQKK